jgi:hypothetical protein
LRITASVDPHGSKCRADEQHANDTDQRRSNKQHIEDRPTEPCETERRDNQ